MNIQTLKVLKEQLDHLEYYNRMAPFPVYDTEYVNEVRDRVKYMEKEKNVNYDELPVAACKYCKSLYIVSDNVENDVCMRCGSVNEIVIYKNIEEYQTKKDE